MRLTSIKRVITTPSILLRRKSGWTPPPGGPAVGRARRPVELGPLSTTPGFLILIALPLALVAAFLGFIEQSASSTAMLAIVTIGLGGWFTISDALKFGDLTLTACFLAFFAFIYAARAIYISSTNDFSLIARMGLEASYSSISGAMAYVVFGILAYIAGTFTLLPRAMRARQGRMNLESFSNIAYGIDHSWNFVVFQLIFCVLLAPLGLSANKGEIYGISSSAYVYLLPTIVHGFDLYFFIYMMSRLRRTSDIVTFQALIVCTALLLFHAYTLSNMTIFRGFYLVGIFCCGVAALVIRYKRISLCFIVVMIAIYPLFKTLGQDRELTNKEVLATKVMRPQDSYTKEGMEVAFGEATDINMLDTFAASLKWESSHHPYFLSYAYVFVHWIPRGVWPAKPESGILSDMRYTCGAPYSPGIIGMFNDDGGKMFMIFMMFVLGVFIRWCEIRSNLCRSYEMQVSMYSALLLSALVCTRYLPYQTFYGFLTFYLPCLACDLFLQRKTRTQESGDRGGRV